ncbi:MAG: helix-turn-helix transcriptional regulator [bacterium]|nr:helix-turn-helix transcriptional regulator [bacterium]
MVQQLYHRDSSHRPQTLADIFLFFFGLSPNCFKNFQISFSFEEGKYGVSSATLRKRLFDEGNIWNSAYRRNTLFDRGISKQYHTIKSIHYIGMPNPKNTIGKNIKRLRTEQNLSQDRLSKLADLSLNTVVTVESGANTNPTIETLKKIAEALKVSVDELIN